MTDAPAAGTDASQKPAISPAAPTSTTPPGSQASMPPGSQASTTPGVAQKSTFVSILAWVFIVLSAGATAVSVLQNLMLYLLFPREEIKAALASGAQVQHIPWTARVMMGHFEVFVGAFLVVSILMLITAIGLLRRWNWARRIFILFMVMGIVWNMVGILLQYWWFSDMPMPMDADGRFTGAMQAMMLAMRVFTAIIAVVMSGVMGWVIWRLTRPAIAVEFGVGTAPVLPASRADAGRTGA